MPFTFPPEQTANAHELIRTKNVTGKVVIAI